MNDGSKPPTLNEVASSFFEVPEADLPADGQALQEALIAEAIRFSLTTSTKDEGGWRRRHILSLRSWVERKLRALIPELGSSSSGQDIFLQILKGGEGANLLFIGDVIELANGYYAPPPTRVVSIADNVSLLVSGLPTRLFVRQGLGVRVTGISRAIRANPTSLQSEFNIPIQDRATYIGLVEPEGFDERALEAFLQREEWQSWDEAGRWICYQGNQGYGFDDHWDREEHAVSSPFGFLSLWKTTEQFGTKYWLRIRHQGEDGMIQIPGLMLRPVCLLLDELDKVPRRVVFSESNLGTVVRAEFPPPAAQARWLHAVGARWMGSKGGWIRWKIPNDTVGSTLDVFDKLPVIIKRGRTK